MGLKICKGILVLTVLNIFFIFGIPNVCNNDFSADGVFRLTRVPGQPVQRMLDLMGAGTDVAPSFTEGLQIFRAAQESISDMDAKAITDLKLEIQAMLALLDADTSIIDEIYRVDIRAFFDMLYYSALKVRRDQVSVGGDGNVAKMLRFDEIISLSKKIKSAYEQYVKQESISESEAKVFKEQIDKATVMAGLWVTSPVSGKPMLDALFAEDSAVMATNTQMIASMPGVLLESMEKGAPVWIEGAMSEVGLPDGYTGNSPQDYADAVRFWTFVLGYDLPYAIHADHTTVKEDTPDAIVAAETLNTAQLEAGYTSFAVDPSSLPAVRGETQLAVLNEMEYKDFFDVAGIGGVTAGKLAKYGTFEKLTGLTKVEGMGEKRIDSLMKYIEARLVLEVLNSATDEELREIPRIDSEILDKLIQHREENGKFNSLDEFDAIIGDNTITIEGIDKPVTLTDYVRTYLDLKRVIEINYDLLKVLPADISKEAEVGHIGKVDPLTGQMKLTTPLEAVVLLESLIERGIEDVQLLAAHNGSKHGVVWKDGKKVPTRVDKERTDELMNAIAPLGAVLAQHGVTGTPFDVLKWMTGLGLIKKANVGTQWRNTALANMPMDLLRSQVKWTIKNKGDKEHQAFFNKLDDMSREEILDDPVLGPFLSSYIKYSIRPYRYEIADMRPAYLRQVIEETRNTAAKFFKAFNAEGKIWLITDHLGWYWLPNSPE